MSGDIDVSQAGHVAIIEIRRPPLNYFDLKLIRSIADALDRIDSDIEVRCVVLAAQGKAFCAGADFRAVDVESEERRSSRQAGHLYVEAIRIFRNKKPIVAAVHGAAIGGGLGLAMSADFRVTCAEARFSANFTKLGFHPGFGLTVTLPEVIGRTKAAMMFYTSRRLNGQEAYEIGLADMLVPQGQVREAAINFAHEIAECSPLGLLATRATMREGLAQRVQKATDHELAEQNRLRQTEDFDEGVRATAERRVPIFRGR
ncbi:enoyl-CoA hydratase/isomerase family protein [Bradyrhizobium sp. HKCCYLS20291]|uniref:enoyl-CoA hydratase/isomerase family protein n=1 Tax=Bradyrhizobium sp. HKCCYLS20291 TaxID=3420766 RepID=UPI003EBD6C80